MILEAIKGKVKSNMKKTMMVVCMFVACGFVLGCGKDSEATGKPQNSQDTVASAQESKPTPVLVKEYKANLTELLKTRKSRENLSFSVAAKVGEEISAFQGLPRDKQEKALDDLKKQLKDYQ